MTVLSRSRAFIRKYPIARGIIAYATIWPTSTLLQQLIAGKRIEELDYRRAARFCCFGALYVAPSLHVWIRFTTRLWPQRNLKIAVTKAVLEQFTYGPFFLTSFFMGMPLLEGRGFDAAKNELQEKFFSTYKVGWCLWPMVQVINHTYIREKNKVIFLSCVSMGWTCFLAYVHQLNKTSAQKEMHL